VKITAQVMPFSLNSQLRHFRDPEILRIGPI
jgi:hypothetical protein